MVGPRQCDERPYKTMVPTLSEKYEDYEPLRDQTPCFLYHLRRPISVETAAGKRSANRALTALNINSEIEETHFVILWRSFDRAMKMAKHTTHDEVGLRRAERVCIRAYNYIAGHIMAMKNEDYERARITRVAHYQAHVALCAKRGTAPPGEDPRAPIKPQIPTPAVAGAEVSPGGMMN